MALDETSGVRKQDGYRIVVGVSKNLIGRYLAWNWIRKRYLVKNNSRMCLKKLLKIFKYFKTFQNHFKWISRILIQTRDYDY